MRILLGRVKGDKGDTGSQGPRGPQGLQGPQGPPGEPGQTDIYTRAESDARYQLKGGASVESFYQWLKERNYNMNNFRGLETIFPVVKLSPITVDKMGDGDDEMFGTAPPNVTIMFDGKTTVSDDAGRWKLTGMPEMNSGEITITWIDYAGRTNTAKANLEITGYCIPKGIQVVTQEITNQYKLNRSGLLEFPKSVTRVERQAFYNFSSITDVSIPSCTYVGDKAFSSCSKLKSVSLPSCAELGNDVFFFCSRLLQISLPLCTTVGSYAFYSCPALANVSLPKCSNIGNNAFSDCKNLKVVTLSESWTPSTGPKIPTTASVFNPDATKTVDWNTMKWVNV